MIFGPKFIRSSIDYFLLTSSQSLTETTWTLGAVARSFISKLAMTKKSSIF